MYCSLLGCVSTLKLQKIFLPLWQPFKNRHIVWFGQIDRSEIRQIWSRSNRSWLIITDPTPKRNLVKFLVLNRSCLISTDPPQRKWRKRIMGRVQTTRVKLTLTLGFVSVYLKVVPFPITTTLIILWPVGFDADKTTIMMSNIIELIHGPTLGLNSSFTNCVVLK